MNDKIIITGGTGQFFEWRVEGCNTTDIPCQLVANGKTIRAELDFMSSQVIEQLGYRMTVAIHANPEPDPKVVFDKQLDNSTVAPEILITLRGAAKVNKDLAGKMATVRSELYNFEDKSVELCVEAEFEYI